jgi:hypothetical protein
MCLVAQPDRPPRANPTVYAAQRQASANREATVLEASFSREPARFTATRTLAVRALRDAAPTLTDERIARLTLAQRPASAHATLQWLVRHLAAGESLDGLPEAGEPPAQADLVGVLANATGYSLDEIQELVDFVWFHPRAVRELSHGERINLIRRSLRVGYHNPSAVAQVALEGA